MAQVPYDIPSAEIMSPGHVGCGGCGAVSPYRAITAAMSLSLRPSRCLVVSAWRFRSLRKRPRLWALGFRLWAKA